MTVTTAKAAGIGQKAAARTEDAVKIYGKGQVEVRALDGVTVEFVAGRYTAIMGPSGSGKSTLLHCAAGLDTLTSGKAYIGDADLSTLNDQQLTRLRRDHVGFVFQSFNLVPTITAAENITLPLLLTGRPRPAAMAAADGWFDRLGLAGLQRRLPGELSGGQAQRVAIARALIGGARVVFADEPTGALDSVNSEAVMRVLRRVCERGASGIMVTHEAQMASWADRVVFLRDGRIVDQTVKPEGPESLLAKA